MKPTIALAALALAASALSACSTEEEMRAVDPAAHPSKSPGAAVTSPTAIPAAEGEVRTRGLVTVIDAGEGAVLCLGGVAESLPPQCTGPALVGWDWAQHPEHESASDVRWGDFAMTGTWDGAALTPTEVTPASLYDAEPQEEEPLTTPCPAPEGGWAVVDTEKTSSQTMDEAFRVASALPGYAMAWMDQSADPQQANDPAKVVINVAVTEDIEGAEQQLREVWGGALCVSEAEHTERELQEISGELASLPGLTTSGGTSRPDHLEVGVVFDDGSIQEWVDEQYDGLVSVVPALEPVSD